MYWLCTLDVPQYQLTRRMQYKRWTLMSWWKKHKCDVWSTVPTNASIKLCTQLTVDQTLCIHTSVCKLPVPWWPHFLWLSTALPLPDKIHNFYLMVQSAWAFWRTLPEIDVSHFRSTEDANYPLETLWGWWCNTRFLSSVLLFLPCSLPFSYRPPPLSALSSLPSSIRIVFSVLLQIHCIFMSPV